MPLTSASWRATPKSASRIRRSPCFGVGEQDVGGLDVAVQQPAVVRVVERARDGGDDGADVLDGHPLAVALLDQVRRVGALDVVHRDPQLALELAAVVHRDDVRMPQRGGQVGFPVESLPEFAVGGHV